MLALSEIFRGKPMEHLQISMGFEDDFHYLVGGLEHCYFFHIYWECHDPN